MLLLPSLWVCWRGVYPKTQSRGRWLHHSELLARPQVTEHDTKGNKHFLNHPLLFLLNNLLLGLEEHLEKVCTNGCNCRDGYANIRPRARLHSERRLSPSVFNTYIFKSYRYWCYCERCVVMASQKQHDCTIAGASVIVRLWSFVMHKEPIRRPKV